jgi:DNA-binding NarL/FixJ family response regulator
METVACGPALLSKVKAAESGQSVVLLDLSTPAIDAVETIAALKALSPPPRAIIAFGPHVHEAKLAAAQAAGCDLVLSRGQFDARAEAILLQYAAHSSD